MKKIGEYTARGIVVEADTTSGNPQKIPLFDGSFQTGYRVVEFKVWGTQVSGSGGYVVGKLSKNDDGVTSQVGFFRADDDNQIAWSQSAGSTDGGSHSLGDTIIDPDNMIVEDLYVYARANVDAQPVNYLVRMEKYEITDWQGALAMARDRAQGDL
jgi:hypothetical protein